MIITEMKRKGNSETYQIFLDDEYFGLIEYEFIYKYSLKKGMNIAKEDLIKILKESEVVTCFNYALKYVCTKFCSEYDLVKHLKKYNFTNDGISFAINKVKSYGYLNDKAFAENVANSLKQGHGKTFIKNKLIAKGIEENIINDILEENDEEVSCLNVAKRWIKTHGNPQDAKQKAKLYRFLGSRGFGFSCINSTLSKISVIGEDDDWN